jgi:hypothetical protein
MLPFKKLDGKCEFCLNKFLRVQGGKQVTVNYICMYVEVEDVNFSPLGLSYFICKLVDNQYKSRNKKEKVAKNFFFWP